MIVGVLDGTTKVRGALRCRQPIPEHRRCLHHDFFGEGFEILGSDIPTAQHALHGRPDFRFHRIPVGFCPVHFQVRLDVGNDFMDEIPKEWDFEKGFGIGLHRIEEGQFILAQTEFLGALGIGFGFLADLHHELDHGGGIDQPGVVLFQGLF